MKNAKTSRTEMKSLKDYANSVFGDKKKASLWFNTASAALGNKKPSELATTKTGAEQVKAELMRIEYGILS